MSELLKDSLDLTSGAGTTLSILQVLHSNLKSTESLREEHLTHGYRIL